MNNCDITDNEAGLFGGGVFNDATGTLNLNGGRIERNEVTTHTYTGGGIYNSGVRNINGCSIAGNTPDDIHDEPLIGHYSNVDIKLLADVSVNRLVCVGLISQG
jgi:hypothetical protein